MKASVPAFAVAFFVAAAADTTRAGTVTSGQFDSPALGVAKNFNVYLPEGYEGNSRRYPVIYLLHGWGVTEEAWIGKSLDLPGTADKLNLQAIVVMPDGDRSFFVNSVSPTDYDRCLRGTSPRRNESESREAFCVRTPRYEDYLVSDLVPHIDKSFRTNARREARALIGESGGGLGAMQLAMRHTDLFSVVAAHSAPLALLYDGPHPYEKTQVKLRASFDSYPQGLSEMVEVFGTEITRWRAHDPSSLVQDLRDGNLAIYFDCGDQDELGFHDLAMYFHERLLANGIQHTFLSVPGHHDDSLWKTRLPLSLGFAIEQFKRAGVHPIRKSAQ